MKFGKELSSLTLCFILGGCALQERNPDEQARTALSKESPTPQAAKHSLPLFINNRLERAEEAVSKDQLPEALALYEEVLTFDPQNAEAHAGLHQVSRVQRQNTLFLDASKAWANNDAATAQMHLNALLAEHPSHPEALELRKRIAQSRPNDFAPPKLNGSLEEEISLSFKEAPLEQVFEILSETSGVNFLFDREVRKDQTVTIFLRKTTVADAIHLILITNQLEQLVVDDNTVIIHPATSAKQREYQQLTVKAFQLVHGDAQNMANILKSLLKARDIVIDDRLNMIVMRDGVETIRLAEKLVALHDVPSPEVMLEVTVLEVKRSRLQDLGIRWPDQMTLSPLASSRTTLTLSDLINLNSDRVGVGIAPLTINASRQFGDANILANPRIRAQNNQTANILIGERVPNITATSTSTGFVSESVQYVDVGLKLDVQPTIYPNDEVAIKVSLEVSNIIRQISTSSGSVVFQIGTRTATTTLRLRDGENQVLAGLITDEMRNDSYAIPGLNDIPIIGRLFSSQLDENQKTEIVLSITPRLIRNVRPPTLERATFQSGTEAAPKSSPIQTEKEHSIQYRVKATDRPTAYLSSTAPLTIADAEYPFIEDASPPSEHNFDIEPDNQSAEPSAISLSGPGASKSGETFSVVVDIRNKGLASIPLQIAFDPDVLEVMTVEEGSYFGKNGYDEFTYRVDRELGQVFVNAIGSGDAEGDAASNVLQATFRARKASTITKINVVSNTARNANGVLVPLDSSASFQIGIDDEG